MENDAPAAPRGYRLERAGSVGSTNDVAMARARAGEAGNLWIVSAAQTGGKGRLGRVWSSPPGNLYASLLLLDPAPAARAAQLGFVAGVALATALEGLTRTTGRVTLKWPNDALLDGAKLSGVLMEATTTPAGSFACVIGIGVNCASHPGGLPYPATSLAAAGFPVSPDDLFAALSASMARQIETWNGGAGFAAVRAAWLARAAGLGAPIEVASGARRLAGLFRTIDEQGRLVLAGPSGDIIVDAGDVLSLAGAALRANGGQGLN